MNLFWYDVAALLPPIIDDVLMRSKEVLAMDDRGTIRVAFLQMHNCKLDAKVCSGKSWKIAGRDFYDFENVKFWMPLEKLPKR